MNKKGIKKILFIFLLVIGIFFINSEVVKAATKYNICGYESDDFGAVELYVSTSDTRFFKSDSVKFDHWNAVDCGGENKPCINNVRFADYHGGLDTEHYIFNFTGHDQTYTCPTLYYKLGESHSSFGTYKRTIEFTWNKDAEHDGVVNGYNDFTGSHDVEGYDDSKKCSEAQLTTFKQKLSEVKNNLEASLKGLYNKLDNLNNENVNRYSDSFEGDFTYEYTRAASAFDSFYKAELGCNPGQDLLNQALNELKDVVLKWSNWYKIKLEELLKTDIEKYGELEENQLEEIKASLEKQQEELNGKITEYVRNYTDTIGKGNGREDCDGLLGPNVKADIEEILRYVRIIAPILVIIFGIVDFSKVVLSGDDKEMSKAVSNLVKRAIAAVAIFFAPIIIMMVIDLVDEFTGIFTGGCDIRGW